MVRGKIVGFSCSPKLLRDVDEYAEEHELSRSSVIRTLIKAQLRWIRYDEYRRRGGRPRRKRRREVAISPANARPMNMKIRKPDDGGR